MGEDRKLHDRGIEATRKLTSPRRPSLVEGTTSTGPNAVPRRKVSVAEPSLATGVRAERRYRMRKVLGRGGMGEVHLAVDQRIGRSVALKVMLDEDAGNPEARARFVREARVQGQLEHPAIVPVYDLDRDGEGREFFAMKRIGGVTLEEVMKQLRAGDEAARQKHSLRRLLSVFQQVCLAIDYAHARGVIHRDIKPSNLMLGDFGEVYVLDWGIAKLLDTDDPESSVVTSGSETPDSTRHGDVLGTIGYMPPEQMVDSASVDARADVYALGAVLFQMLTLEPLHGRGSVQERARSTQVGADARASVRAPARQIPPELDAICVKATALDPADRYASARELHDAIERFLEGDRDLRLRAELAERHVAEAKEAAARAIEGGPDAAESRKRALREAGRALALDPENAEAAGVLAELMLAPPKELPPEVRAETRALVEGEARRGALFGAMALLAFALVTLLMVWTGLRSVVGIAWIVVPLAIASLHGFYIATARNVRFGPHAILLSVPICTAIGATSGLAGPLFLTPLWALAFAVVATALHGLGRYRIPMIALACCAVLVPALAEWIGLMPSPYVFHEDGSLTILPRLVELPESRVRPSLLAATIASIVLVCVLLWRFGAAGMKSRQQLQLHAWHLRQLAPDRKRDEQARDER